MKHQNSQTRKAGAEVIELTIDSLSYNGGRGVGRYDGIVGFVPATAPGDRIRARITNRKARFFEAELVEIIEPSAHRRIPPCEVAGRCGGCSWQHVEYSEQVEQKKSILASSLRGLMKLGEFQMLPFLAAPDEFYYRNRIQIQIRGTKFGFFAKGTNDLVETRHCRITEPAINERLNSLSSEDLAGAKRMELALNEKLEVVEWSGERDPETAIFGQINRAQNEILKTVLLGLITEAPDWAMDLYAGSGNLTFPLARHLGSTPVLAVELSRESVVRGQQKNISNIEWQAGDVGKVLAKTLVKNGRGCIVLDPPRPGCDQAVIDQLLRHRPKQIVYVSCNPATFARDAQKLCENGQYNMVNVQGLDMFPQTEHVELVGVLCAAT